MIGCNHAAEKLITYQSEESYLIAYPASRIIQIFTLQLPNVSKIIKINLQLKDVKNFHLFILLIGGDLTPFDTDLSNPRAPLHLCPQTRLFVPSLCGPASKVHIFYTPAASSPIRSTQSCFVLGV